MDVGDSSDGERSTTPESNSSRSSFNYREEHVSSFVDEESLLRHYLERVNLLPDRLTADEISFLPSENISQATIDMLLCIRNTAITTWLSDPQQELGIFELRNALKPPYNSDAELLINVHHFLQRNGLINVGWFQRTTKVPRGRLTRNKKVIVIGAGLAGIAAATQLQSFGLDVTILEAKPIIGGRVSAIKFENSVVELGGDVIQSFKNNPLKVLTHQMPVETLALNENFPLYDGKGALVNEGIDGQVFESYTEMRKSLMFISDRLPEVNKDPSGLLVSRQRGFDNIFNQWEFLHAERHLRTWENYLKLNEQYSNMNLEVEAIAKTCETFRKRVEELEKELKKEKDANKATLIKTDIICTLKLAEEATKRYDTISRDMHSSLEAIGYAKSENILHHSMFFSSPNDFRNFHFYFALEELVYGGELDRVQLSKENQKKTMMGGSTKLRDGIANVLETIVAGRHLDIRTEHVVKNITYDYNDVTIHVEKNVNGRTETEELTADICVCTLPLGVLKKVVSEDPRVPKFYPPLPQEKVNAIKQLGFGTVNKVCLVFDSIFWAAGRQTTFGRLADGSHSFPTTRGELMLFQATPDSRVLNGYLVGASAETILPDEVIVNKAMKALGQIFGPSISKPRFYKVTKWHMSDFAYGSHTYMGLNTKASDFEDVRSPLRAYRLDDDNCNGPRGGNTKENDPTIRSRASSVHTSSSPSDDSFETKFNNKVFFAGEHTTIDHHATMEGAWLSGLAAAADVANELCGTYRMDTLDNLSYEQLDEILRMDEKEDESEDQTPTETSGASSNGSPSSENASHQSTATRDIEIIDLS